MFGIPGTHLWAAAVLAPAGFVVGFGAAWAAAAAMTTRFHKRGYDRARRRHD